MKKFNCFALAICYWLIAISSTAIANPVTQQTAQTVATNFYSQTFHLSAPNLTLTYTESSTNGQPDYYVFNVANNGGFVIVSAEDATNPIIGYSNKGQYVIPTGSNNIGWWMNCRKQEIEYARNNNMVASSEISNRWTRYINNTNPKVTHSVSSVQSVNPLLQSTWDQPWPYNAMCPGNSVTGCVATAMAQIMRYWSYPPHGHGYSGYWERQPDGFANSYGYLSADYDTSTYVWSAMPYSVTGTNNEVAKLMYDCGVSVDMDYSPPGSGAWVIKGDYPVCSQNSYVKYFGYNAATIRGVYESNYSYQNWIALIENELNNSRPVQYVGNDSVNNEGHTWVCDGYDVNNNFDMNWGWSGYDNGYFSPSALNVLGLQFNWWNEAVIGIEPPKASAYFSGSPTFGCKNLAVTFHDSSIATSPIASYQWLFPGGTPSVSNAASPKITYNTPGTYDVTEIITVGGVADTTIRIAYISVADSAGLPMSQNFQSATFPPAGWVINNPYGFSYTWQLNNNVGGYGKSSQCMYFNNTQVVADFYTLYTGLWVNPPGKPGVDVIGQRQQIYTPEYDFTYMQNPELYFDVAYAPFNANLSDTLNIYYSTDCGQTFTRIYSKGGMTLGTTGNMVSTGADTNKNGIFVPLSNNWRTDTIHLPALAGMKDVLFSFENLSGNGAAMYIDNINIGGQSTASVPTISSQPSVSVYPNPTTGQFTIQLSATSSQWSVEIYNVLGEKVYSNYQITQSANYQIDLSSQPKGVYIYRIFTGTGSVISTGRVILE